MQFSSSPRSWLKAALTALPTLLSVCITLSVFVTQTSFLPACWPRLYQQAVTELQDRRWR
jgi:hypothetical protein